MCTGYAEGNVAGDLLAVNRAFVGQIRLWADEIRIKHFFVRGWVLPGLEERRRSPRSNDDDAM